jgi:hypothetical protein
MFTKKQDKASNYTSGTYQSIKGGSVTYKSSWELAYMKYLDSNPAVQSFQYEGMQIAYMSDGRTHKIVRYIPDFLVNMADGSKILVEIKPFRRTSDQKNINKMAAAKTWCDEHNATLQIITEVDLKKLGLI